MYRIIIQQAVSSTFIPSAAHIRRWAKMALRQETAAAEIVIRIVDKIEIAALNNTYRKKKGPTNVLSFPMALPEEMAFAIPFLGDIAICADIVNEEALAQKKPEESHWAHMVVHGILHLLGYDHQKDHEANCMESREMAILATLGFPNPYQSDETIQKYE